MKNNDGTVEIENNEETGEASTQAAENSQTEGKENVESEVQKMADAIVAKKLKGMPTKEELKAFKEWQDSQKTEVEKQNELTQKMTDTKLENDKLKQRLAVADADVSKEFRDFVRFTVSEMEGDFEDNLQEFLKANPKYLQKEEVATETSKTNGVATKKIGNNAEDGVEAILKAKHPDLF